ncbi:short chain dehydrogenase [Nonomuraea rhizosphaerae]|uniref:short chain dehydrogenase n=1 Tax=Nonomuraea rhizosphaerae TaxID=2665663 RepID=UPI001C5E8D07|nr:short chain dehydrogenase [Nonomuraea rhizosphaerae]
MRILLIGATGTLGMAVGETLAGRGHEIIGVARKGADLRFDVTDPAQVSAMYDKAGPLEAVVSAAGHVPYRPVAEMTPDDYLTAFRGKVLSQIELVRQGLSHVAERGSFTLITGVLGREPVPTASAASMANGAVEAFVRAAAIEIAPRRVNAVSPSVFTESAARYEDVFPGMPAVDLFAVCQAFVRSVEGMHTGRVYMLP